MKYKQGHKDHEQGKEPRYPLEDDMATTSENTEEVSRDEEEEGSMRMIKY